ncbi:MAG: hypothetical protein ACOCNL_15375, partial [Acetivibrio ethanolgignens]
RVSAKRRFSLIVLNLNQFSKLKGWALKRLHPVKRGRILSSMASKKFCNMKLLFILPAYTS